LIYKAFAIYIKLTILYRKFVLDTVLDVYATMTLQS